MRLLGVGSLAAWVLLGVILYLVVTARLFGESRSSGYEHDNNNNNNNNNNKEEDENDTISFLAIGDWGGQSWFPYHTVAQKETAKGMGNVAANLQAQFVIALGDNFYRYGVDDVNSQRFGSTFESVYQAPSLTTIPWYVIGGNHDYYGNVSAQIDYTQKSSRWNFPSLYHSHSFRSSSPSSSATSVDESGGFTIDLVLIDTVDLCGLPPPPPSSSSPSSDNKDILKDDEYFAPLPYPSPNNATKQWTWIEERLEASHADYLLVGGHYPVYSACSHGPTQTLIERLVPLLEQHNAHYVSGHDHCMVHYEQGPTQHILTGMGDECCYEATNLDNPSNHQNNATLKWLVSAENKDLYQAKGGFTSFRATKNHLMIQYHDQDGNVLHVADPVPPRSVESRHY